MILRILMVNTVFFMLFAYRRARGIPTMRQRTAIKVQSMLIVANALILFQNEIQSTLDRFM